MSRRQYFVSAYTASPSAVWHAQHESDYFKGLAALPHIIGIEHPILRPVEKYPLAWLKQNVPSHWSLIITTIPAWMSMGNVDPHLGLAAANEVSRLAAVEFMREVAAYVVTLNNLFGRSLVKAVHFQSFPKNGPVEIRANKAALINSLQAIKQFDWQGAALNLEHCDAFIENQRAEKGLLTLSDEIEAIAQVGGFGMALNWARSAIETRSTHGPVAHLKLAKQHNVLKGFFFSGCTDDQSSEYGYWKDSHMPLKSKHDKRFEASLLDASLAKQIFSLLDNDVYCGIKVSNLGKTVSAATAIKLLQNSIAALTEY